MKELKAYLCGWLTAKFGVIDSFVRCIDVQNEQIDQTLPYFALGVSHGLGEHGGLFNVARSSVSNGHAGPYFAVPLLSSTAITDLMAAQVEMQISACEPQQPQRPEGPMCDVVREGRSDVGKLIAGRAVFPRARGIIDRIIDAIASDCSHCRG